MNKPAERGVNKAVDGIQQRLTNYAHELDYDALTPVAIQAAKARTIDTLGALIGGFFGEPCRIARNLAAQMPDPGGATIIGTRMKTTPDMAAFVNACTAHSAEMADSYHWPGSSHGHPSDALTPVLAAAEHAQASGREFITAVVLAYEVYLRFSDAVHSKGFDNTNFACVGTAVAAGKLLGLSAGQLAHCISMAVIPNNILKQAVKMAAAGQAGRAFEGKAGWCEHIAGKRFSLDTLGGNGTPFKILDTLIKDRPCNGSAVACVHAAEKVAPLNLKDVKQVIVETYKDAKQAVGTGEHRWKPDTRGSADHSGPYVVAATLMDGTFTLRSYNNAHLWNPELRALMRKIEFVENEDFTRAFEQVPVEHRMRVTVITNSGERLVGETGGGEDDFSAPKSDARIEQKFRGLTEDFLGTQRVDAILDRLWNLEKLGNVAEIPAAFVLG